MLKTRRFEGLDAEALHRLCQLSTNRAATQNTKAGWQSVEVKDGLIGEERYLDFLEE